MRMDDEMTFETVQLEKLKVAAQTRVPQAQFRDAKIEMVLGTVSAWFNFALPSLVSTAALPCGLRPWSVIFTLPLPAAPSSLGD